MMSKKLRTVDQPQWLVDLAEKSYDYLSKLPPSAQPTWFRLHHGDWNYLLKEDKKEND